MSKSKTTIVYNVFYLNSKGGMIDQTQIDEYNEELAWQLFREFGHQRRKTYTLEFQAVSES